MNSDTFKKYNELFQRIRKYPKNKFQGEQLECISKLVFFGGVQRQQIPELRVRDVFDGNGKALDKITKLKKEIILSDEMKRALEDYFNDLKSRCSTFTKMTEPLFRNYRTERKLRLHWMKFGTGYSQIKRDGNMYKKAEEQRRYEERKAELQKWYEDGNVDMICDPDDDRWN